MWTGGGASTLGNRWAELVPKGVSGLCSLPRAWLAMGWGRILGSNDDAAVFAWSSGLAKRVGVDKGRVRALSSHERANGELLHVAQVFL